MTERAQGTPINDEAAAARDIVEQFLIASMVPDPETAATFLSDDVVIHFTGKTRMSHPSEMAAYNAKRYKWVKKNMERTDVAPGPDSIVVYGIGTLYGEWLNGVAFEGNRYVDRFEIKDGKIVKIDVWNDSAERILKGEAG